MNERPSETPALNAVQMLREEYRAHFNRALEPEDETTRDGPISHRLLAERECRAGLALSGGGIRSATFALGVLQTLSKFDLLSSVDYLSTVSGGGYIGGWLSGWAHRQPGGIRGVTAELGVREGRSEHEAAPVRHLRRYSNYLTPRIGLLSSDTWTLVGTYVRNLLVNWLVLVPYFVLLLLVPLIGAEVLKATAASSMLPQAVIAGFAGIDVVTLVALLCLVVTMAAIGNSLPSSGRPGTAATPVFAATMRTSPGTASGSGRVGGASSEPRQEIEASGFGLIAITQQQFLWKAMLPLVVSGIALATAWLSYIAPGSQSAASSWLASRAAAIPQPLVFTALGVIVHVAAFTVYVVRAWLYEPTDSRRTLGRTGVGYWRDIVSVVLSGGFGGWLVWLAAARIVPRLTETAPLDGVNVYVVVAVPLFLLSFVIGLTLYTALASGLTSEEDREWLARAGGWILAIAIGWVAVSGVALLGPALLEQLWNRGRAWAVSIGGLSGVLSMWLGGSGRTKAKRDDRVPSSWTDIAAEWGLKLAAPVFVVLLAVLLAAAVGWLQRYIAGAWSVSALTAMAGTAAAALAVIGLVNAFVNPNVFSLHGMYRDRLIRAYLGASRGARQPHAFTGFDPNDNVPLAHLAWPFLCVNDWPFVYELAKALSKRPAENGDDAQNTQARVRALAEACRDIDTADRKLIAHTLAVARWDEASVHDIVDRFNHVLIYSEHAQTLRTVWDGIVRVEPPAFGEHEWWTVRGIADAVARGRDQIVTGILIAPDANWCGEVARVGVWDPGKAEELTKRLNQWIAGVDLAPLVPGPLVPGAAAARPASPAEPGLSFPTDAAERRRRLEALLPTARKAPLLIVNTAINLVSGKELAWQERKAASFTFTPLHAGSPVVGYRPLAGTRDVTKCYGGKAGVTLGTAMTISGAAANPNMGCHSSPIVTLLLTLFNARLGAWIGNPADPKRFTHAYPRQQPLPMALREAFGLTDARGGYVHLSDGGHFENLGLYELVRRGCRLILVSDAGCDEQYAFEDLGNAVRKIRVDLGIEIEFQGFRVGPSKRTSSGHMASMSNGDSRGEYVGVGTIYYCRRTAGALKGRLLYVKPALFEEDEPIDVRQYGRANPAYPHESTADQSFNESQFESYRALGEHILRTVGLGGNPGATSPGNIAQLFDRAEAYLKRHGATAVVTNQP